MNFYFILVDFCTSWYLSFSLSNTKFQMIEEWQQQSIMTFFQGLFLKIIFRISEKIQSALSSTKQQHNLKSSRKWNISIRAAIYVQQYANISAVKRENAVKFSVEEYEETIKRRQCQSDTIIALPNANNGDQISGKTLMKKFNQKSECRK